MSDLLARMTLGVAVDQGRPGYLGRYRTRERHLEWTQPGICADCSRTCSEKQAGRYDAKEGRSLVEADDGY